MIDLLTASEAYAAKLGFRYFVEVASDEVDYEGVPVDFKIIDAVVAAQTQEAVQDAVVSCDWLKGYTLVSFWKPDNSEAPF